MRRIKRVDAERVAEIAGLRDLRLERCPSQGETWLRVIGLQKGTDRGFAFDGGTITGIEDGVLAEERQDRVDLPTAIPAGIALDRSWSRSRRMTRCVSTSIFMEGSGHAEREARSPADRSRFPFRPRRIQGRKDFENVFPASVHGPAHTLTYRPDATRGVLPRSRRASRSCPSCIPVSGRGRMDRRRFNDLAEPGHRPVGRKEDQDFRLATHGGRSPG